MVKFIFITGGVISSLGKGIAASSLGALLEARNLKVTIVKLDPYLNMDPGTMSPFQHGEVFVTEDGAETDLDLGHYERFIKSKLGKRNNFTTGQVYETILQRERNGDFLGGTVQVIPHVTDEIKRRAKLAKKDADGNDNDIVICEVGGTVGDIESQPFMEALRQMRMELGEDNSLLIHLTWVPFIAAAGETKTKPTQHSVKELRSIGLQPDILLCRSEVELNTDTQHKIAQFTNVEPKAVISLPDAKSIYSIPGTLQRFGLDQTVAAKLKLPSADADLSQWDRVLAMESEQQGLVRIGMVGKYTELVDAYKSLNEALVHAGIQTGNKIEIVYLDSEVMEQEGIDELDTLDAILIPGGFGVRGVEGKIQAVRYARENNVPYLGICLGMQVAIIEYCRHVIGLDDVNSTEFAENCAYPVIGLISEWMDDDGQIKYRNTNTAKGGTMRLGKQNSILTQGSKIRELYQSEMIAERHRHRYEVNNQLIDKITSKDMQVVGWSEDKSLVEAVELSNHPWFIGCQFHPEFTSTPIDGHPLFTGFIQAAIKYNTYHVRKS